MKRLLIFLIFPWSFAIGQNQVTLDDCYLLARKNYPNLKHSELWHEISGLKKENIKTSYLPQVTLNAQATYQSDVPGIDIPLPDISIPTVSKDQYKAYFELKQTIWDGGISSANLDLEEALLQNSLNELEVELYKLNEQVAQTFFTILVLEKQKEVLLAQKKILEEKRSVLESAVKNGMVEKSSLLVIQAEILNLEQSDIQCESGKNAAIKMLSVLTGKEFSKNTTFTSDKDARTEISALKRPELNLFASQAASLENQMELLDKTRNPKIFGFGQAGYGKPGLNMLNDDFDTYYLVGIGISWHAFDWKNTFRKKQILKLQQGVIDNRKQTFKQNIELLLARQNEEIDKLETVLKNDTEIISLRNEISKAAASKLENETITASDFVQELQAETAAKLSFELHKIQLKEAIETYLLIQGK